VTRIGNVQGGTLVRGLKKTIIKFSTNAAAKKGRKGRDSEIVFKKRNPTVTPISEKEDGPRRKNNIDNTAVHKSGRNKGAQGFTHKPQNGRQRGGALKNRHT